MKNALLSTFVLVCLSAQVRGVAQLVAKSQTLDDVREAIIRFEVDAPSDKRALLDGYYEDSIIRPQRDKMHEVYFICVSDQGNEDPSEDLLKRFANHVPSVKRRTEGKHDPKPIPEKDIDGRKAFMMYAVRDKGTGQIGANLRIMRIRFPRPGVAEVDGALHSGGLYGEGYVWVVVRDSGHWRVKRRKGTWIS
jgi:hypothetical protein